MSQQVGDLLQAQVGVRQVVLGQIAAYVIDEFAVTRTAFASLRSSVLLLMLKWLATSSNGTGPLASRCTTYSRTE
jgi:hypothetical protein